MSAPPEPSRRYAATSLPFGINEADLEDYFRQHDFDWLILLRSLVFSLDRRALLLPAPFPVGRPPLDPLCLLGLCCYGLLCGVSSLRGLESLAVLDAGAWYMGRGVRPDHSTLARFLLDHQEQLTSSWFTTFLDHCIATLKAAHGDDFRPGTCALDGSVVEAAASRHRTLMLPRALERQKSGGRTAARGLLARTADALAQTAGRHRGAS